MLDSFRFTALATALLLCPVGNAEPSLPQTTVTEPAPFETPAVCGWSLAREIHAFETGGYCAANMLYALKGQEKVLLYESPRPVRLLAAAGPYWVLWDTKLAHLGSLIFVVHVPSEGKPFIVFQSQQVESRTYLRDELIHCQCADGELRLKIQSTDVDTGKRYEREFSLTIHPL